MALPVFPAPAALLLPSVPCQQLIDPESRIQQIAQGIVMIQVINDQGNIFAHIHIYIIRAGQQVWYTRFVVRIRSMSPLL